MPGCGHAGRAVPEAGFARSRVGIAGLSPVVVYEKSPPVIPAGFFVLVLFQSG